jgi:hypothetical protein
VRDFPEGSHAGDPRPSIRVEQVDAPEPILIDQTDAPINPDLLTASSHPHDRPQPTLVDVDLDCGRWSGHGEAFASGL